MWWRHYCAAVDGKPGYIWHRWVIEYREAVKMEVQLVTLFIETQLHTLPPCPNTESQNNVSVWLAAHHAWCHWVQQFWNGGQLHHGVVWAVPAGQLHLPSPQTRGVRALLVQPGSCLLLWGHRWLTLVTKWHLGESRTNHRWDLYHRKYKYGMSGFVLELRLWHLTSLKGTTGSIVVLKLLKTHQWAPQLHLGTCSFTKCVLIHSWR